MRIKFLRKKTQDSKNSIHNTSLNWSGVYLITSAITFVYIFMEWLFIITKPSFITVTGIYAQLELLGNTVLLAIGLESIFFSLAIPLSNLSRIKSAKTRLITAVLIFPSIIAASLVLLLFDNFTYTILGFGIVTSQDALRLVYAVLFLTLIFVCFAKLLHYAWNISAWTAEKGKIPKGIDFARFTFVLIAIVLYAIIPFNTGSNTKIIAPNLKEIPHIFLITGDGINANSMSVYGYQRNTTPNLLELASSSLVANNAYTNSSSSQGSTISIFTGKYPTQTRVLIPPNILQGKDAYQHLPGILKSDGYYSIQISFPYYVDAGSANLLGGFDLTNQKAADATNRIAQLSKVMKTESAFFVYEVFNRISERIQHIFFIQKMTNPFDKIQQPPDRYGDVEKIQSLIKLINETDRPLFVHLHLMDTHGPTFAPNIKVFSKSETGQGFWDEDLYDDAIVNFDNNIGLLIKALKAKNSFDKSILIVGSDHGQQWSATEHIPLIVHFPKGEFSRKVDANVQNIDIAPTILDYLGLPKPEWMEGDSFLRDDPQNRPIFSAGFADVKTDSEKGVLVNEHKNLAPYFQFEKVGLVNCDNWYKLNLVEFKWESGKISGSTSNCSEADRITDLKAFCLLENHLKQKGFDTANLTFNLFSK